MLRKEKGYPRVTAFVIERSVELRPPLGEWANPQPQAVF